MKEGTVVAGTRTIPVLVKESLVQQAEALCKDKPIARILAMPPKHVRLVVTGSEVFTGRIKDGFGPIVSKKVGELGSSVDSVELSPDDPDVIASHIKNAKQAGAEIILVSGGMRWTPTIKRRRAFAAAVLKWKPTVFPCCPVPCS